MATPAMTKTTKTTRTPEDSEHWHDARIKMVECIARHFTDTEPRTGLRRMGERLQGAMSTVPRHWFVPRDSERVSYRDSALPIGHGQTISQPFIVALMIELADLSEGAKVLEVGTGCGYETAVLSLIVDQVYTIELVPELSRQSSELLVEQGFEGIHTRCGDGFAGWEEAAPFDAILVTAFSSEVPEPLLDQLAVGGRMVIPIGSSNAYQELQVIEKRGPEDIVVRHSLPVAFVPLVHSDDSKSEEG